MSALARPRQDRWIAGVCAAVAHRFDVEPNTVRLITLLLVLFAGLSFWAYILLWIVIPNEE